MFGLSFEKLIIVGIFAALVIGPQRLPHYAQKLGEFARLLRAQVDTARTRAAESMGTEDWRALDPRQYDPRRIIREALDEPGSAPSSETAAPGSAERSDRAVDGESRSLAEATGSVVITVRPDIRGDDSSPARTEVVRATISVQSQSQEPIDDRGRGRLGDQSLKSKSSLSMPGNMSSYLII